MRIVCAIAVALVGCTADAPAPARFTPRCPLVGDYALTATFSDGRAVAFGLHAPDPMLRFRPGPRRTAADNREYEKAWFVSAFQTELTAAVPALGLEADAHTLSLANPDLCTLSVSLRGTDGDLELELTVAPETLAVTGSLAGEVRFEPVEATVAGTVAPVPAPAAAR